MNQDPTSGNSCLYLSGSTLCPAFTTYIDVTELAQTYSFFSDVTDVATFDAQLANYFQTTWVTNKLEDNLGCNKVTADTVVQWQTTVMCSTFAFSQGSQSCSYALQGASFNIPRVCGATCAAFNEAETALTQNTTYCPARDSTGNRASTLSTDLTDCYNVSADEGNCVTGAQNEPGTCGFGTNTALACEYCATSTNACCNSVDCSATSSSLSPTDSSTATNSESRSTSPTSSGTVSNNSNTGAKSKSISGGAIAGIVIGVIAAVIIAALVAFFLWRRRRQTSRTAGSQQLLSAPAPYEKEDKHSSPPLSSSNEESEVFVTPSQPPASNMRPISTATTNLPGMAGVGAAMAAAASPKNRNLGSNSAAPVAPSAPTPMLASAPVAISVGAAATAIHPYEATLDDELTLAPGMKIAVKEIFDDGWASGTVISGGSAAQMDNVPRKFPVVCVTAA